MRLSYDGNHVYATTGRRRVAVLTVTNEQRYWVLIKLGASQAVAQGIVAGLIAKRIEVHL